MKEISILSENIDQVELETHLKTWLDSYSGQLRKVLLLPPDGTRYHSKAGLITQLIYQMLTPGSQVDILPALGTHLPMTDSERRFMFGDKISMERFLDHDWRKDVVKIGEVPADFVAQVSEGLVSYPIPIEINRRLLDPTYDLIVSIGQVVPHEVVGMANYSKNILVGCGGKELINKSHFLGAAFGMERMMGRDHTPVRRVFDYAETEFLKRLPLQYILTVTSTVRTVAAKEETHINGLFIGKSRTLFETGVRESQKRNLDLLESPLKKVVVYLDPQEFKSTWLGNKAIYRTRMAIADGGELLILAPGVRQFGEDTGIDALIRKYGYVGSQKVLALVKQNPDLGDNLSAAAHLIHGSSEGRFTITYAPGHLTPKEVEAANFKYLSLADALQTYDPDRLQNGFNTLPSGEKIFYISNPALGLWALKAKFI